VSHASGTVVDSSVLLDVFTMDTAWGDWSQLQLTRAAQRGALILNAVVVAEIAPRFERIETLRAALPSMAVIEEIPLAAAFLAGHAHANYRRAGGPREAVLPDFLIGGARRHHRTATPDARSATGRDLPARSDSHRS
jgi:hypothetical protein